MVYFPMFQDIPQLISKDYSIVQGKVMHINSKIEEEQAVIAVERKSYTGKIFVIIVIMALNTVIIKYVLNLRIEKEYNKDKKYETLIYKTIHMRSFMFFELLILLQSIVLVGAILGHHSTESDKIWTILLLIELINLIIYVYI